MYFVFLKNLLTIHVRFFYKKFGNITTKVGETNYVKQVISICKNTTK